MVKEDPSISSDQEDLFLEFDTDQERIFRVDGQSRHEIQDLRPKELELLRIMNRQNRDHGYEPVLCRYNELVAALWPERSRGNFGDPRALLARLVLDVRRKIEPTPDRPRILPNVSGRGYRLRSRPFGSEYLPPFIPRRPVLHPRLFFGRQRELNRIFRYWRPNAVMNAAVVGPKRSGKTSLLHFLRDIHSTPITHLRAGQRGRWLVRPDRFHIVLVEFQEPRMRERDRLLRYVLENLGMPVPDPCRLSTFLDVMAEHLSAPTIILMDKIERAIAAEDLDLDFWDGMHALGSSLAEGNLGFVLTADGHSVWPPAERDYTSAFFSILNTIKLGPLTDAEAREMVSSSPIPFEQVDVEWIIQQSHCWPAILQVHCDTLLTALRAGETGAAWRNEALNLMADLRHLLHEP